MDILVFKSNHLIKEKIIGESFNAKEKPVLVKIPNESPL